MPVQDASNHDHRTQTADVLDLIADMLEQLTPEQWESPSLDEGWRVKDVVGHLVWRVGSNSTQMLKTGSKAYFGRHVNPMRAVHDVSIATARASYSELVRDIRMNAIALRTGLGRKNVGELSEAVVHGFDISNALGIRLPVPADVTEAVARSGLRFASHQVHEVVKHRTLVATDAGWSIGQGPAIEGTAEAIVLYLYRRRPRPR